MKHFILLLLAVATLTSCSVSRRVSREAQDYWIGRSAVDIMRVMGDPDSIDVDGKDGSILRYEMKPDYEDPSYDILDPDAKPRENGYANFYVDSEGECYWVDTDRKLIDSAPNLDDDDNIWVDILYYLPLLLLLFVPIP